MLIFAEGGDHPYEMSELQLREFLAKMVSKDILELANGVRVLLLRVRAHPLNRGSHNQYLIT